MSLPFYVEAPIYLLALAAAGDWPWYLAAALVWLAGLAFVSYVLDHGLTGERPDTTTAGRR